MGTACVNGCSAGGADSSADLEGGLRLAGFGIACLPETAAAGERLRWRISIPGNRAHHHDGGGGTGGLCARALRALREDGVRLRVQRQARRRWRLADRSGFGGRRFGRSSRGFCFGSGLHGGAGLARFAGAAIAVASTIPVTPPVAIPVTILAHGAFVAGYLVEVVVLFEEVRNVEKRVALEAHIDETPIAFRAGHA